MCKLLACWKFGVKKKRIWQIQQRPPSFLYHQSLFWGDFYQTRKWSSGSKKNTGKANSINQRGYSMSSTCSNKKRSTLALTNPQFPAKDLSELLAAWSDRCLELWKQRAFLELREELMVYHKKKSWTRELAEYSV